jgi:hypothetical protein
MAAEVAPPIEVESVRDEERFFGGDIAWWALLQLVSIPVILIGLSQIPATSGFLILSVGGVMAGVAFAQITFRLPYITNGFVKSLVLALVASLVIGGIALLYNMTLTVPDAPPDVMFKPPISGG